MVIASPRPSNSKLWKAILKVFFMVYENVYVMIREGKASFYFDKWLGNDPLTDLACTIFLPKLTVQDCWDNENWKEEELLDLIGVEKKGQNTKIDGEM